MSKGQAWRWNAFLRAVCMCWAVCALHTGSFAQEAAPGNVYVVLWFDTEDYILPESDDAAKRIATFLTEQGVQATFKIVGEKARTLERRQRNDVIAALQKHAIGYHSNTHSQHPTPAEYESLLDWEGGVAEFTRRERGGFDDVQRIFKQKPCCYGQPGSSWAPQAFPALADWGVGLYLDEGSHVGLNGEPFYYGGLLNIFNTKEGPQLRPNEEWTNVDESKARFRNYYGAMSRKGGLISLYFHPCEFIHSQFWDMNFASGANPPRDQWQIYPLRPSDSRERAFRYLEELVRYMRSFPKVRFITGPQAMLLYADRARGRRFDAKELSEIARRVKSEVSFQEHEKYTLSPAEVMMLLAGWLASHQGDQVGVELPFTVNGPSLPPPSLTEAFEVPWPQFARSLDDLHAFLESHRQVPNAVWVGSRPVTPEAFLAAMAKVAGAAGSLGAHPETVKIEPASLVTEAYVARDSAEVWSWPIFPAGFHSEHLMELAKRQAWTLKPAKIVP